MALENTDYSYLGLGPVYIRKYGSKLGMDDAGNCSQLNFAVTEDSKKLTDYTKPGGGTRNEVRRITAVEVTLTMHDFSPLNLARAVYGEASALVSDDVKAEPAAAFKGKIIRLAHLMPTDVVVKSTGGSPTTYVEGVDYVVSDAGLIIPADSSIPDAVVTAGVPANNITVDYTYGAGDVVEALVNSGKEWELVFAGLNEARSGKPMVVEAYRIKFGAASALALIADDFGALELTGTVLSDGTKVGTGISKYFKATIAK